MREEFACCMDSEQWAMFRLPDNRPVDGENNAISLYWLKPHKSLFSTTSPKA
jgi:hypothetical protein